MNPFGASVGPMFLLPDWNDFLDPVHHPLSRLEGVLPMWRAHRHCDCNVAQLQMAHAMDNRRANDRPTCVCLVQQLMNLLDGHLGICLVVEGLRPLSGSQLSDCSQKQNHRTRQM